MENEVYHNAKGVIATVKRMILKLNSYGQRTRFLEFIESSNPTVLKTLPHPEFRERFPGVGMPDQLAKQAQPDTPNTCPCDRCQLPVANGAGGYIQFGDGQGQPAGVYRICASCLGELKGPFILRAAPSERMAV